MNASAAVARNSTVTPDRWSAHLSMLFSELPVLARPHAARAAGFSIAETWWPGDLADAWAAEIADARLAVALVNADAGDIPAGERGFLNVPSLRERELGRIEAALALAERVACPRVNVLVGRITPGVPEAKQRAAVVDALRDAATAAAARGLTLVIEPINTFDVPGYFVPTAAEARRVIEAVGSDCVRLLYDAYHAARSGRDPVDDAPQFIDVIEHVQYADCPGRGAPGTGRINIHRFADALRSAGYDGPIGLEYDARGDTAASLAFLA